MARKRKGGPSKGAVKASKKATKEEVKEEVKEVVVEEAPAEPLTEAENEEEQEEEEPTPKKAKTEAGAKRGKKGKAAAKPASKKVASASRKAQEPELPPSNSATVSKVIIIEASKECKSRAQNLITGLKKALPDFQVLENPKPRKECFEIRDQEGNVYVSLLEVRRPYTKLKSVDLDKTVEEIVAKIK